jgi:hypothetical protein
MALSDNYTLGCLIGSKSQAIARLVGKVVIGDRIYSRHRTVNLFGKEGAVEVVQPKP